MLRIKSWSRDDVLDAGWVFAIGVFAELVLVPVAGLGIAVPGLVVAAALVILLTLVMFLPAQRVAVGGVSRSVIAWAAFSMLALASLAWSANAGYGAWKLGVFAILGLLPAMASRALVTAGHRFTWRPLAVLGAVYLVLGLLVAEEVPEYPGRLTLPGGNPIWLARTVVIAGLATWWSSGWPVPLRVACVALAAYLLFASGSRGPAAAAVLVAGYAALRVFLASRRKLRLAVRALPIAAIAGLGLALGIRQLDAGSGTIARNRILASLEAGALARDENVLSRSDAVGSALEVFTEQPLLGVGLGGLGRGGVREYPHNLLVEVAAELGLVGLVLLLAAGWAGWRVRRGDTTGQAMLAFCMLSALVSGDLGTNAAMVAFALAPPLADRAGPA